jgi:hypothetical protein
MSQSSIENSTTLNAIERHNFAPKLDRFVSGHDFSRARKATKIAGL